MKLGLDLAISHSIDLELKRKASAINRHFKRKVEILEFHAPRSPQACKQRARHSIEVCRERAHVAQVAGKCRGPRVGFTGNQLVGDNEGLAVAKVAGVVKRHGLAGENGLALGMGVIWSVRER